jgi:Fe-S cluster biogenesis protein NfuA
MIQERIEKILEGITPMLKMQGKDIKLVSADDARIKLAMTGFCSGCGCSDDYLEGLNEMISQEFPHAKVEIELS